MHTGPMPGSAGEFGEWKPTARRCPQDGCIGFLFERKWDSSCGGYTDHQYQCNTCPHKFWIDGDDG